MKRKAGGVNYDGSYQKGESLSTGGKQTRLKKMTVNSGKMIRKGLNCHERETEVTL